MASSMLEAYMMEENSTSVILVEIKFAMKLHTTCGMGYVQGA